jgi:hypothetical protein
MVPSLEPSGTGCSFVGMAVAFVDNLELEAVQSQMDVAGKGSVLPEDIVDHTLAPRTAALVVGMGW